MFDHILAKFKGTTALTFKVLGEGATTQPRPTVEGVQAVIPYNTVVTLPQPFYDVVVGAGYRVELIDDEAADEPATEEAAEEQSNETKADGDELPAEEAPDETLGGGSDASAGGSGDQSGAPGADPSPAFDADAVIDGNVDTVAARLAGLTDEQLALVKDAEIDREVPRKGVTGAIEAEIAAREAAKQGDGA